MPVPIPFLLSEPTGTSELVTAALWAQGLFLGTVATTIAVVAIAAIGFMMMSGRISWRRGATVVLGCFLLFGAPTIVAGLRGQGATTNQDKLVATSVLPQQISNLNNTSAPYDPYAGASVPPR